MQTLYESQPGLSCAGAVWEAVAVGFIMIPVVMLVLYAVLMLTARKASPDERRLHRLIIAGVGLLLLISAPVAFLVWDELRAVEVSSSEVVVRSCNGPKAEVRTIARADIVGIAHSTLMSGSKSPVPYDAIALTVANGEPVTIPLNVLASIDFKVLETFVPRQVLVDWAAALRSRGEARPEQLAAYE